MSLQHIYYKFLQKIFRFNEWHVIPADDRPYAIGIIRKINYILNKNPYLKKFYMVEIGCGLGDVCAGIQVSNKKKVGYDIEKRVIYAAKCVHPRIKFRCGTFSDINIGKKSKISFLIALNFLHLIDSDTVFNDFNKITQQNDIEYIVVDKVYSPPYRYSHDFNKIMTSIGYTNIWTSRGYGAWNDTRRYIYIFKKVG